MSEPLTVLDINQLHVSRRTHLQNAFHAIWAVANAWLKRIIRLNAVRPGAGWPVVARRRGPRYCDAVGILASGAICQRLSAIICRKTVVDTINRTRSGLDIDGEALQVADNVRVSGIARRLAPPGLRIRCRLWLVARTRRAKRLRRKRAHNVPKQFVIGS